MTGWQVVAPPERFPVPPGLGRLAAPLAWLAGAQGAWPPHLPREVRTVVLREGAGTAAGRARADALADGGADLLVVAADGDPVPALVAVAALLRLEPVAAVGTTGAAGWAEQVVAVRAGLPAARPHVGDPAALLDAVGDPLLGELTGLLAQAATRRTPVLLDGSALVLAAGVLADRLAPGTARWLLAGATPAGPAAARALGDLRLEPLLDLGLHRPEAAALALRVLLDAVDLVRG